MNRNTTPLHIGASLMLALQFSSDARAQDGSETISPEVARATAYVSDTCSCMYKHYSTTPGADTAMKVCLDQAQSAHNIPTEVTETFTVELGPTKVTHPKLFTSDDANQAYATKTQECTLQFSLALQGYKDRAWSEDAICMSQCADEGVAKPLCNTVCMDARLPPADSEKTESAPEAPPTCEEQCAHLNGRSQYACKRKCEKAK